MESGMPAPAGETQKPRVVIVGAGFGGLSLAKGLAGAPYDVTLIDRHNYHLFQPLLYQVATAALSPADIAAPIRAILRGQTNVTVVLADVSGVDVAAKVVIAEGKRIPYDILVLATGAQHAYFGHDDWAGVAPGLKTIDDATYLRRQILLAFERAEAESDAAERARLLTFVVVGGGPTGVEMAGAIAELAKWALAADFRNIDPRSARIILVEGGPRLLAALNPSLSEKARQSLEKLGVEVRLNAMVTSCSDRGRRHRRRTHRDAYDHVGRGRQGVAGRRMAGRAGRSGRAGQGRARYVAARAIRTSSCSATRRSRSTQTESRCRALRRSPSSRASIWRSS